MTIRRRTAASTAAVVAALVGSAMGALSCQRAATSAPAAPAPAVDSAHSAAPAATRTSFDRAVAMLEARTGEHLALALGKRDYTAVYPAWLPDNRLVVPALHGVTILDPRTGATTAVAAKGQRAVVSADGKTMAIASSDSVELIDVKSGASLAALDASLDDDSVGLLQFSPDSRIFGFPMKEAEITGRLLGLYDLYKRELRGALELRAPTEPPTGMTAKLSGGPETGDHVVTFALRNDRVVASLASGATALWDAASLEPLLLLRGGTPDLDPREQPALLSDDGAYATAWIALELPVSQRAKPHPAAPTSPSSEGSLRVERRRVPVLLDARRGQVVMRLDDKQCPPFGVAMHPREPLVAVGSLYPGFCVWDLAERKVKRRFRIPSTTPKNKAPGASLMLRLAAKMSPKMDLPIEHVAFDASGERVNLGIAHLGGIVVRLSDGSVSDGSLSKDSRSLAGPGSSPVAISPDQTMMAGSGAELRIWDVASGRVLQRIGHHERLALLDWSAEAITIVGVDGTVVRLRAETGELAERRARPSGFEEVKSVSNGTGILFMLNSRPGALRALRLDEPAKIVSFAWTGTDGILGAAVSGDARRLAVSTAGELALFDAAAGTALRTIELRSGGAQDGRAPTDVALDEEGQLVAAIVEDAPRLWEVATGREIALSPGDCTSVKFLPKTHYLVSSCRDKVRVWDGRAGTLVIAADSGDLPEGLFFDAAGERIAQLGAKFLTLLDGRTLALRSRTESSLPTWTAAFSPSARFVAVGLQNGEGIEFYRVADGKRVARLQMWPNDEAWIVRTDDGQVEVLGDVGRIERELECRVGTYLFPTAACQRFLVKGLLGQLLSERMAETP